MAATSAPLSSVQIGDITLTYLPDGINHLTPTAMYASTDEAYWREQGHVLDEDGWLILSIGALLIQHHGVNTMLDLGYGPVVHNLADLTEGMHHGDIGGGKLLESLAAIGVAPSDISSVVFSHLHPDHTGWLEVGGTPVFPNADYFIGQTEWDYWNSGGALGGPNPIQTEELSRRMIPMDADQTPVPGVTAVATPGHTPGHLSFVLSSGRERAVVLGDMVHCPLEIGASELDFIFDVDPVVARETKRRIERELVMPNTTTVGAHFPDAVFGRVLPGSVPLTVAFSPTAS